MDNQKENNKEFAAEIQGLALDTLKRKKQELVNDMQEFGNKIVKDGITGDELKKIKQDMQTNQDKIEMIKNEINTREEINSMMNYAQKERELNEAIDANEKNNNNDNSDYKMSMETRGEQEQQDNAQCRDMGLEVNDDAIITMGWRMPKANWCSINDFSKAYNKVCPQRSKILCRDSSGDWNNRAHREYGDFVLHGFPAFMAMETATKARQLSKLESYRRRVSRHTKIQCRDLGDDINMINNLSPEEFRKLTAYLVQDKLNEYTPILEYMNMQPVEPVQGKSSFFFSYMDKSGVVFRAYNEGEITKRGTAIMKSQEVPLIPFRGAPSAFSWESLFSTPSMILDDIIEKTLTESAMGLSKFIYSPVAHMDALPQGQKYNNETIQRYDMTNAGLGSVKNIVYTQYPDKITYADIARLYGRFTEQIAVDYPEPILLVESGLWTEFYLDQNAINDPGTLARAVENGMRLAKEGENPGRIIPFARPIGSRPYAISINGNVVPVIPVRGLNTFVDYTQNGNGGYTFDNKLNLSRASLDYPLMTMVDRKKFNIGVAGNPDLLFDADTRETLTAAVTFTMQIGAYVVNPIGSAVKLLPASVNLIDLDGDDNGNVNP